MYTGTGTLYYRCQQRLPRLFAFGGSKAVAASALAHNILQALKATTLSSRAFVFYITNRTVVEVPRAAQSAIFSFELDRRGDNLSRFF